jgi:hypothetical protein
MVADILETVFIHPGIDVFVLATGDSDFSAVARKLREYGRLVVGIGLRQATSEVLVNACDHLVEPETHTVAYGLERRRVDLREQIVCRGYLLSRSEPRRARRSDRQGAHRESCLHLHGGTVVVGVW